MDGNAPPKVQSNEEIIEELTKDLENSCVRENVSESDKSDDPWDNIGRRNSTELENHRKVPTDKEENDADDFVDEEALKDREIELNDEEKEKLKTDAENLKNEGNILFKNAEYEKAAFTYTQGLQTCPLAFEKERAILYANRAAAKTKYMDKKTPAIEDCTKAIELNCSYVKAYVRRAHLYEETDKLDEALEDYKKIVSLDPGHAEANCAMRRLPPLIQERNEKLKEEMLGKLKDLGNMVLKPFGLSTNNFELQKDPNSGGYSVKFQQNPS